jgi:hypothetical protein
MPRSRLRLAAIWFVRALGISIIIHFVLLGIAVLGTPDSLLVRTADTVLVPGMWIAEKIVPGHTGVQIFYAILISAVVCALVLLPLVALVSILRRNTQ